MSGEEGTCATAVMELKLLADVGLVGFPNAGKSSLLRCLSRARPRIGSYAFTTLRPQLGTIVYEPGEGEGEGEREVGEGGKEGGRGWQANVQGGRGGERQGGTEGGEGKGEEGEEEEDGDGEEGFRLTVSDIPGLIQGASENRGLGHEFLRHIQRTRVLVFVLDMAPKAHAPAWDTNTDEDLTPKAQSPALGTESPEFDLHVASKAHAPASHADTGENMDPMAGDWALEEVVLEEGWGKEKEEGAEEEGEEDEEREGVRGERMRRRKGGALARPPWDQLRQLVTELEAYERGLAFSRPALVVANKADEPEAQGNIKELRRQLAPGGDLQRWLHQAAMRALGISHTGGAKGSAVGRAFRAPKAHVGEPEGPTAQRAVGVPQSGGAHGREGSVGGVEVPRWVKGRMAVYPTCAVLGEGVGVLKRELRKALIRRRF